MTEKSYFHNGTAYNDALELPYSADEFSDLLELLNAPMMGSYVLPGQLNNLAVTAGAGRTVDVASGRAFIKGHWYENSAVVNLALSTNTSGLPRWDRVVIQLDLATGTPSLKVIEGGYAAVPYVPALAPTENVVQLPLARIYIPDSYAAAAAYYVHDERQFANNAYHQVTYSTRNLFINGNFILFGCNPDATAARRPMDAQWTVVANGTRWRGVPAFPTQMYGRAVRTDLETAGGDGFSSILLTTENAAEPYTISLWVHPTAGEVAVAFGATTIRIPATAEPIQLIIRGSFTGYQTFSITHQTTGTDAIFGDIRLSHGYVVAEELHVGPALVMMSSAVQPLKTGAPTLTGLTVITNPATAWKYWGSDEDYEGIISEHAPTVAPIIILKARDSGSAAGAPLVYVHTLDITPYVQLDIGGITNSVYRYAVGLMAQTNRLSTDLPRVAVYCSPATSLDVEMWVIGAVL